MSGENNSNDVSDAWPYEQSKNEDAKISNNENDEGDAWGSTGYVFFFYSFFIISHYYFTFMNVHRKFIGPFLLSLNFYCLYFLFIFIYNFFLYFFVCFVL